MAAENQFVFPPPFDVEEVAKKPRKRKIDMVVPDAEKRENYYRETVLTKETPIKVEENTSPIIQEPVEEKPDIVVPTIVVNKESKSAGKLILKILCGFIGAIAVSMSLYLNSCHYLRYFPIIPAVSMAIVVCGSSAFLPEVAIFFYKQWSRFRMIKAIPIMLVAVLAMLLSMSGIVAGLYNGRSDSANVEAMERQANESKAQSIAVFVAQKDSAQSSHNQALSALASAQAKYDNAEKKDEWRYYQRLIDAQKREKTTGEELKKATDALTIAQEESGGATYKRRDDFYTWLGDSISMDADKAEFTFSALPAIFLDIIAPFMLAVAFFL